MWANKENYWFDSILQLQKHEGEDEMVWVSMQQHTYNGTEFPVGDKLDFGEDSKNLV